MRRRLFVIFGVVITLSAVGAIGFMMVLQHQLGGGSPWQRMEQMTSRQFARVWDDPTARARRAQDIADSFPVAVTLLDMDGNELFRTGTGEGRTHGLVVVQRGGTPLGRVRIRSKTWQGPLTLVAALLIFVTLLWLASGRIARRIVLPLEHLADVARDIGDGQLTRRARLGHHAPGEVGQLAGSINDMAGRIEQQIADQRALLATVSHELRTPLGHLRILLELAEDDADPTRRLAEMGEEVIEMDALVGELLASARLDFKALHRRMESPSGLASRALERTGVALERLSVTPSVPASVVLDPTLVASALANLLDNARKHGGGVVGLTVDSDRDELRFEVHDEGAGFDPATREQLFAPFVDGGSERSALGLGLSLVRRIAEAHGGRAFASNRADGGACFGFSIPLPVGSTAS